MIRIRPWLSPVLVPATLLAAVLGACGGGSADATPAANAPRPQDPQGQRSRQEPAQLPGERVRLLLSGSMHGRLEPCGCASGQLGGLARRLAYVQETPVHDLLIEGGDLVNDSTRLDLEKAFTAVQVLFGMRRTWDVLAVGPNDLELPLAEWTGLLSSYMTSNNPPRALLASDLVSVDGQWPAQAFFDKEVRGVTVRVAALTMRLPSKLQQAQPAPFELLAPAAAWARAMQGQRPELRKVLLVHSSPDEVRKLAKALQPAPDLLVGIDDTFHEPPGSAEVEAGIPIVFPGIRGRILLDVTLARTAEGRPQLTGYERIELRGSETRKDAGQDPDVKLLLLQHRQFVKDEGVLATLADRSEPPGGVSYVGSAACKDCHPKEHEIWAASKHALAWRTLVDAENDGGKRYGWPVTHYPDCVSCHVVGFRQPGGFVTGAETPELVDVGCERCHGPGSKHVATNGMQKLGKVGNGSPSLVCTQCHDFEQSPTFDYNQRWAQIRHGKQ
jgi:hypothetical protein